MDRVKIVPLLSLNLPGKLVHYSTMDVNVVDYSFAPISRLPNDNYIGTQFKAAIIKLPNISRNVNILKPSFKTITIKLELANIDRLQDYANYGNLLGVDALFSLYDLNNKTIITKVYGKIDKVSYGKEKFSFTIVSIGDTYFTAQPSRKIDANTFQTVHVFGPFNTNPLKMFGLLVDITHTGSNGTVSTDDQIPTSADGNSSWWPGGGGWFTNDLDETEMYRAICVMIEHPSLYNEQDDYWVGSLLAVYNDPYPNDPSYIKIRSDHDMDGNPIANSVYTDWPYPDRSGTRNIGNAVISRFCLGATGYVIRSTSGNNATYDVSNKIGRIWFDVAGPNPEDYSTTWDDAGWEERLLPNRNNRTGGGPGFNRPVSQRYENRTQSARNLGDIDTRHTLILYRRPFPENVDADGKVIPIAYGYVYKGLAVHAIGQKAISNSANITEKSMVDTTAAAEGAGNDYYIICGHTMAHRFEIRRGMATHEDRLDYAIQFRDINIWNSLDQHPSPEEKATKVYLHNNNEDSPESLNPMPRKWYRSWDSTTGTYSYEMVYDPMVMWFNASEPVRARYSTFGPNRQVKLIDNSGSDQYSGFKLRGDEYWEDVAGRDLGLSENQLYNLNRQHPQYLIRFGLGNSNIYMDFPGHPDFPDGWLTGIGERGISHRVLPLNDNSVPNPAGLITHPADIVAHFLLTYTNLGGDRSRINWQSFRHTKSKLFNWRFSVFLNEEQDAKNILNNWLSQMRAVLYYDGFQWYLKYIDILGEGPVKYVFTDAHINRTTLEIQYPDLKDVYSKIKVKYNYWRPHDTYLDIIEFNKDNNDLCKRAATLLDTEKEFVLEANCIADRVTAMQLGRYLNVLYTRPRLTVSFVTPIKSDILNLQPGDNVVLILDELPKLRRRNVIKKRKIKFVIQSMEIQKSGIKFLLLEV